MDYAKVYSEIIERAKKRNVSCYTENHHVIPKCCGGFDDESNMVRLTAKEHLLCHKMLVKMYPNEDKLSVALYLMIGRLGGVKSGRLYESYRKKHNLI